jgi:hypothetical protein
MLRAMSSSHIIIIFMPSFICSIFMEQRGIIIMFIGAVPAIGMFMLVLAIIGIAMRSIVIIVFICYLLRRSTCSSSTLLTAVNHTANPR